MGRLDDREWRELQRELTRVISGRVPGWTDGQQHDPGVAILQLVSYLLEELAHRDTLPDAASPWIARILDALSNRGASGGVAAEVWSGATRSRYFSGRLLTAADFAHEQEYHLARYRRHLKACHGHGIVGGLAVGATADGRSVTIAPGLAIDPEGREVHLPADLTVAIPAGVALPAAVVLEYAERATDPVPASSEAAAEASRVEEGCRVLVTRLCEHQGVEIARLRRAHGGWEVDGHFVPPRAR